MPLSVFIPFGCIFIANFYGAAPGQFNIFRLIKTFAHTKGYMSGFLLSRYRRVPIPLFTRKEKGKWLMAWFIGENPSPKLPAYYSRFFKLIFQASALSYIFQKPPFAVTKKLWSRNKTSQLDKL